MPIDLAAVKGLVLVADGEHTTVPARQSREYKLPPQPQHWPAEVRSLSAEPYEFNALASLDTGLANDLTRRFAGACERDGLAIMKQNVMRLEGVDRPRILAHAMPPGGQ